MTQDSSKIKVAILGGGMASLTAAFELTRTPDLRSRYDVTVYQLGWRLGGKGASGRSEHHARIEEHGLHVWFGFYDNAFEVMQQCYAELARPPDAPLATFTDAFTPCDTVVLFEQFETEWASWEFTVPRNERRPGGVEDGLPTFWDIVAEAVAWAQDHFDHLTTALGDAGPHGKPPTGLPARFRDLADDLATPVLHAERSIAHHLVHLASHLAQHRRKEPIGFDPTDPHPHFSLLAEVVTAFKDAVWDHFVRTRLHHKELRHFFTLLDTATAMMNGILGDGVLTDGFSKIDDQEFIPWLRKYGARQFTVEQGPLVRAFYDMAFAFEGGFKNTDHPMKNRNMAAGTALQDILRLFFTYKGAFYWKMEAGMGDTVFVPLYDVLRQRGVTFEFFHVVTNLGLAQDKRTIDTISAVRQARPKGGSYDPCVLVNGLSCWPSTPKWDELEQGEWLRANQIDFEQTDGVDHTKIRGAETRVLRRGQDFDHVILGIPVGALPGICTELLADADNPPFANMVSHSSTVMTQAFQLWLTESTLNLGWPHHTASIATCFEEPIDTYCDMSHLLAREEWPDSVHGLVYICGVMPDVSTDEHGAPQNIDTQAKADAYARKSARTFLDEQIGHLWLNAALGTSHFDPGVLADPDHQGGDDPLDAQFVRANFQATERYVQTPAGSVKHRLAADQSGYDNLTLTGDWIKTGLNAGCIEAAAMAGRQAARALTGSSIPVRGEDDTWLRPTPADAHARSASPLVVTLAQTAQDVFRPAVTLACETAASLRALLHRPSSPSPPASPSRVPPAYVEYGGLATAPGPFTCDATLFAFFLEADHDLLSALCRKVLCAPTDGELEYYPLGRHVMLTFGDMKVEAEDRTIGSVNETHAAFWIMTAAVHRRFGVLVADRFASFVPYMFVENPISLVGGREIYGFAKNGARLSIPTTDPTEFRVEAFGGDFAAGNAAAWHPLLRLSRTGSQSGRSKPVRLENAHQAATHLRSLVIPTEEHLVVPGEALLKDAIESVKHWEARQVFLRQFRAPGDNTRASSQEIVEAKSKITHFSAESLLHGYDFELQQLDSHPIQRDLGVTSQHIRTGLRASMTFVQEPGQVIWSATR